MLTRRWRDGSAPQATSPARAARRSTWPSPTSLQHRGASRNALPREARTLEVAFARAGERTGALSGRLAALSPLATLDRGYAVVTREDGSVVTSAAALQPDDAVQVRLRDGTRSARITG